MPDTLSVDIKSSLNWLHRESQSLSTVVDAAKLEYAGSLADGSGDDQADLLWHDERTLAVAASEDLDLTNLTRSLFGDSLAASFARIKTLLLINKATAAGEDLLLGGAGAGGNGWSGPTHGDADAELEIPADAMLLLVNKKSGWTVTNGVTDILRITNNGTASITYQIVLAGVAS